MTSNFASSFVGGRERAPLIIAGILSALAYLYLALHSGQYGEASLTQLLTVCAVCLLVQGVVFYLVITDRLELNWLDLLFFAVLFRLIGVNAYPVLEDDFFRYLWDGWVSVTTGSPYGVPPSDFFAQDDLSDRWSDILDGINYPDVPTVYGPTAQWLFELSYHIAPGQVWPLQILAAAADIGVILVLRLLVPLRWLFLYAWSPLLVKEFAFTAHFDVVGVFFLVLGLFLRTRQISRPDQIWVNIAVGILVGLACGIKIFALLAAPFLLQIDWRGWLSFLLTIVLIAIPFGFVAAWLPDGLYVMGSDWLFNAPIYISAGALFGWESLTTIKIVCVVLFAGLAATLFLKRCGRDLLPLTQTLRSTTPKTEPEHYLSALTLLFGCLLFVLPVFNPWYLVWWLAFAALRPSITAWTCSVVVLLSYITGINTGDPGLQLYEQPIWVWYLEFGAIGIALLADGRRVIRLA